LKVLNLASNNLVKIPDSILELSCLEELYLEDNPIKEIPKAIIEMPTIRILKLPEGL
jgi:Leucine-rich repeat (LRR) protein